MFINNEIKKQLEKIANEEENKKCFDCDNQPARWTSLNNGIFLCHECSEDHKKFESKTNIIKSINLDQWNKNQLNMIKVGGNKKLKNFLENHNVPKNIEKSSLYNSKIMFYYRNQLKAEALGEVLLDQLPPKEEFWISYEENNNDGLNINNTETNSQRSKINNNLNHNENFTLYDNDKEPEFINGNLIDYPKNNIDIDKELYSSAKQGKHQSEESINKTDTLLTIEDDPKYSSISNENNNNNNNNSFTINSGYLGTIGSIFHSIWNTSSNMASAVKEKMNEYQIGKSILYLGGQVYNGVVFIGEKIIEKSSDLINSETAKNLANKASEGLIYLANKMRSNNNEINNNNNYTDFIEDNKNNEKVYSDSLELENNYGILNDKKENLV